MSKYTKSPTSRIIKTANKISFYENKIAEETGRQRHRTAEKLIFLKRSLRHFCKLYVWGIK